VTSPPPPGTSRRRGSTGSALHSLASTLPVALLASACTAAPDRTTAPASPQAAEIDWLWNLSLWLGSAVWVVVMVLLAVPLIRSRRAHREQADDAPTDPPSEGRQPGGVPATTPGQDGRRPRSAPGSILDEPLLTADADDGTDAARDHRVRARLLWIGGIIGPAIILFLLLLAAGRVGALTAHVERPDEIVVEVTGHMFWWEVHYPDHGVTTANEIHVPVDRPVRFRLFSEDVIHSFWIPRMHGKIDTIPGQENWLSFEPTETGRFRGACAEFCGIAHAQMVLWLQVQTQEEFDSWVQEQAADAPEPETPSAVEGERVFIEAGCAACHAVRGTGAVGGVGPDLTHLARRETLASGIVPNDREHLEELIVDPWGVKPGNPMPPTALEPEELEPLLDYLMGLE
jgi:cytochrome c oxidase subunit II